MARKARELLELVHDIDPNANVQIGFNLGAYRRDRAMADALIKPLAEALRLEYHHRQGKLGRSKCMDGDRQIHPLAHIWEAAERAGLQNGHDVDRDGRVYLVYYGSQEAMAELLPVLDAYGVAYQASGHPGGRPSEVTFEIVHRKERQ